MKPQNYLGFENFMVIAISSYINLWRHLYKFSTTFTL